ncbi:hypothetical protein F5Y01DRAFT_277713 [Xylaria sp. FL0043]|nr:hypothetical protein F5Y01DRAFT_277713 [Xylaria sp. FL0043]
MAFYKLLFECSVSILSFGMILALICSWPGMCYIDGFSIYIWSRPSLNSATLASVYVNKRTKNISRKPSGFNHIFRCMV